MINSLRWEWLAICWPWLCINRPVCGYPWVSVQTKLSRDILTSWLGLLVLFQPDVVRIMVIFTAMGWSYVRSHVVSLSLQLPGQQQADCNRQAYLCISCQPCTPVSYSHAVQLHFTIYGTTVLVYHNYPMCVYGLHRGIYCHIWQHTLSMLCCVCI